MRRILFILLLLWANSAGAQETGPADKANAQKTGPTANECFSLRPIDFYQKHISPVIGGKCPMYPSCSNYAKQAVKKHGPVLGWFMACDRLMRCGRDELTRSKKIRDHEHTLYYDPVSNNDFWLKSP